MNKRQPAEKQEQKKNNYKNKTYDRGQCSYRSA